MNLVISSLYRFYEATHHAAKREVLTPIEAKLEKAIGLAFKAQGKAFTKGFIKFKDRFDLTPRPPSRGGKGEKVQESAHGFWYPVGIREALDEDEVDPIFGQAEGDSLEAFLGPLTEAVKAALQAAGLQQVAELGIGLSFSLANPRALAYIKVHGAELVAGINAETRSEIQTVLGQAMDEGWSYGQTARAIIQKYDDMAATVPGNFTSRAERIAVTEAGNAYEEGNFEPVQELMAHGIEMEKSWDTAPEITKTGPCPLICQPNHDEGWIAADQAHQSGDDKPLGHVGCVCDELYRAKGTN